MNNRQDPLSRNSDSVRFEECLWSCIFKKYSNYFGDSLWTTLQTSTSICHPSDWGRNYKILKEVIIIIITGNFLYFLHWHVLFMQLNNHHKRIQKKINCFKVIWKIPSCLENTFVHNTVAENGCFLMQFRTI